MGKHSLNAEEIPDWQTGDSVLRSTDDIPSELNQEDAESLASTHVFVSFSVLTEMQILFVLWTRAQSASDRNTHTKKDCWGREEWSSFNTFVCSCTGPDEGLFHISVRSGCR